MKAASMLAELEARGFRIRLVGDEVRVAPRPRAADLQWLRAEKDAIVAELQQRSRAVAVAASMLRRGEWPREKAPCAFPIGPAGAKCLRCLADAIDHDMRLAR